MYTTTPRNARIGQRKIKRDYETLKKKLASLAIKELYLRPSPPPKKLPFTIFQTQFNNYNKPMLFQVNARCLHICIDFIARGKSAIFENCINRQNLTIKNTVELCS